MTTDRASRPAPKLAAAAIRVVAAATPVAASSAPYDRTRWEQAVLGGNLHHVDRLVAFVLAHYAGPAGLLPQNGVQGAEQMARLTGLSSRSARQAVSNLAKRGLLVRPPLAEDHATTHTIRPITLTLPQPAAERVPPSPADDA